MPSGRAVHRRRSAHGSKKRGASGGCTRGCGASGQLTSCCRVLLSYKR